MLLFLKTIKFKTFQKDVKVRKQYIVIQLSGLESLYYVNIHTLNDIDWQLFEVKCDYCTNL